VYAQTNPTNNPPLTTKHCAGVVQSGYSRSAKAAFIS